MDKVMPQIQMPPKEEEVKEPIPDSGKKSDKELINQIQEEVLEEDYDDEPLINITERIIPDEDDVFGERPVPKVKPILDEEEPTEEEDPPQQEFKPTGKRKYTRKAPMSQKQKDHLARIRKIASEKRAKERVKKEEEKVRKEEEKEEARIKKAEERLLAKQNKEKKVQSDRKSQPIPEAQPQSSSMMFTRDDMERAMFSAISSYEIVRKKEKEEKKKRELAEARERQMQRTLQQAIQPDKPPDQWRHLFS